MLQHVSISAVDYADNFHSTYKITASPYGILTEEGKMYDIDDEDYDRW